MTSSSKVFRENSKSLLETEELSKIRVFEVNTLCLFVLELYQVSQKMYTSLKSYVLRTHKSLNCVSLVRQDLNLNFEA